MTTLQLQSHISIEVSDLLGGVSQLDTPEIERLLSELQLVLARRKANSLSKTETKLLRRISEGVPEEVQVRYDSLQQKSLEQELRHDERAELVRLIDVVESADANRLKHLIELSQLRQLPLNKLMHQLGIQHPPAYG